MEEIKSERILNKEINMLTKWLLDLYDLRI